MRRCAVLGLSSVLACSTWRSQPVPLPGEPATGPISVVLRDGERVALTQLTSTGDSLIGETGRPPRRYAVALRDVARVERREVSVGRTAGLVVSLALIVGAITGVIVLLSLYSPIA
jgi:hypothetical protein